MSEALDHRWRDILAEGRLPVFALVCLGSWLNAADALVTSTIMPSVGAELGGYAYFGWAIAGFYTGCILAGATAGRLAEMAGIRASVTAAGAIYGLGCLLSAWAPSIEVFLAGRMVQGLGGGWITGFGYVIIGAVFPERHVVKALAATSAMWSVATFLGPLFGGLFAAAGHWRWTFWAFAGQAAVYCLVASAILKTAVAKTASAPGVPILQVLLLTASVTVLAVAGLLHQVVQAVGLAAVGAALLALTLYVDARAKVQLLPRKAADLASPIGQGYAALFLLPAAGVGLATYGPALLQTLRGLSPVEAGYVVAVESVGLTIAAMFATKAAPTATGRYIILGGACTALGVFGMAWAVPSWPLWSLVALVLLQGSGFGFAWGLISQRVIRALDDEERVIGSAGLPAVAQAGCAFGAALAGGAANLSGFAAGMEPASAARAAFWVFVTMTPVAVAAAWTAWLLGRRAAPVSSAGRA